MWKYSRICILFLVIIFSVITTTVQSINTEKNKITKLYTGEVSATIQMPGVDPSVYQEIYQKIDQIPGVTTTNTYLEQNGEAQNTLFIDETYFNKFMQDAEISGSNFDSDDFAIIFEKDTRMPVLISKDYASEHHLKVGDETTIENYLPNICELYTDGQTFIGSADGTTVENSTTNNKDLCQHDSTFDYLENENGFADIPVVVKGIYQEDESGLPGYPSDTYPDVDVIIPNFILDNSNQDLYDLNRYENHQPIYTKQAELAFLDYDTINNDDFNQAINQIEQEYAVTIDIERASDWQQSQYQEQIKAYNQVLVNYGFIALILVIIWLIYNYYKLIFIKYEVSVFILLGVPIKRQIRTIISKSLYIDLLILLCIIIIGLISGLLIMYLAYFILIYILDLIITLVKCLRIDPSTIMQNFSEGEL